MIGRYLCGKSQDENFGKDKADHLRDISQRLHQLVRTEFPAYGNDACLDAVVLPAPPLSLVLPQPQDKPSPAVPSTAVPKAAVPKAGGSAASSTAMPSLIKIDSCSGRRVGPIDRLLSNKMDIGSKVYHGSSKGVYAIEEVPPSHGHGTSVVKLKLLHKCVNMEQLWTASC